VANRLIAEALHPYPRELVIATKLGAQRLPDQRWAPALRPEQLRQGLEHDLRTLRRERLDLVHLRHLPGAGVPFLESLDAVIALQAEGKIRHLGLSNVDASLLEQALARIPIVAVQNLFGVGGARLPHAQVDDPAGVLELCTRRNLAFVPFSPLSSSDLARNSAVLAPASKHGASPAQIVLAWLLARSPVMLPIPGTSSVPHLEQNWAARHIALSPEDVASVT
jgi:aryl-alcohol dehydrogenase-like predicted oxidoreductase